MILCNLLMFAHTSRPPPLLNHRKPPNITKRENEYYLKQRLAALENGKTKWAKHRYIIISSYDVLKLHELNSNT